MVKEFLSLCFAWNVLNIYQKKILENMLLYSIYNELDYINMWQNMNLSYYVILSIDSWYDMSVFSYDELKVDGKGIIMVYW